MLGLKYDVNLLVDYDPEWPREFARERERIVAALGGQAKAVEHYGSTSVPSMRAKPIIDILVGIDLTAWEACRAPLEGIGYQYWPEAGVDGHRIFVRGGTERTHLLHLVQYHGPEWGSNLRFRNELRKDSDLRKAYLAVKECAALKAPTERLVYNKLKGPFIEAVKARLATD